MLDELIEYLSIQLTLAPSDLLLSDEDRHILVGQIALLDQIKTINEKGYPDAKDN